MRRSRPKCRKGERGAAMLAILAVVVLLSSMVVFMITIAGKDRIEAGKNVHDITMQTVAESSLQYAKSYFGQRYNSWSAYFAAPYPPPTTGTIPGTAAPYSELYPPMPSGFSGSCFIYARNDVDVFPPANPDPKNDHNFRIFVGAVCRQPRPGLPDVVAELESPLQFNPSNDVYTAQNGGGAAGTSNFSR